MRLETFCALILGFVITDTGLAQQNRGHDDQLRNNQIRDFFSSKQQFRRPRQRALQSSEQSNPLDGFRTIDGFGNNISEPLLGTPGSALLRLAPSAYFDSTSSPARPGALSAREISNLVCAQSESVLNNRFLTDMVWQWGQFVDHDIDLTESAFPLEEYSISVPTGDVYFDPTSLGTATIMLFRSEYDPDTGTGSNNPRQQVNAITAWIDGSNIYGSDEETAATLRRFRGGLLLESANRLLPVDEDGFYMAGDVRANEQVGLTAMHTLFMREHNRIAANIFLQNPELSDEQIYQQARRQVIAKLQVITYNEFLPALLGKDPLPRYQGYRPAETSNIANEFSTAAYRFGHSMLSSELQRIGNDGLSISEGPIALQDAFFNPSLLASLGIDPYLRGLASQQAQELDQLVIDDVRNFLFGAPGSGGFDLASLNIQRGRDHGLPDFNTLRMNLGLAPVQSFEEITSDPARQVALAIAYVDIDQIDPWVGILSEDHVAGSSVGETAQVIIRNQFQRLRDADRFWYQREFQRAELSRIEATTLATVIRDNTGIRNVQDNVFIMSFAQQSSAKEKTRESTTRPSTTRPSTTRQSGRPRRR